MHRSRYYRNSAMYQPGSEYHPRFPLSRTRSTYKTTSVTPYSPSQMKEQTSQNYSNPRFVDRSKYVWTANKQSIQSTPQTPEPTQTPAPTQAPAPTSAPAPTPAPVPTQAPAPTPVPAKPIPSAPLAPLQRPVPRGPHDLTVLTVTALDPPVAVAKDIALHLREKKLYLIRKVVDVVGVKKSIKLYYDTRNKESNGGILVQNGQRRRTPGGVFLSLLRETSYITAEEAEKVFDEIKKYESRLAASGHYYPGGRWNF